MQPGLPGVLSEPRLLADAIGQLVAQAAAAGSLRTHPAPPTIRVNEIMVGLIDSRHGPGTRGWTLLTERQRRDLLRHTLLGRTGQPEEVAKAFDELYSSGKVRFFGVSNHSAWQIELLRKHIDQPIVVNQLELTLENLDVDVQSPQAVSIQRETQGSNNIVGYSNPEVDRLIAVAREAPDYGAAKPVLARIQDLIVADQPVRKG